MNINWEFIYSNIPLYKEAMMLTLMLAFWGVLGSLVVGLICSGILYFKLRVIKTIVKMYIELSRNTPLLIQLYFLYFGLTKIGLNLSENACAVIGLTFLGGSYMCEAFRGGIEAVSKSQIQSAVSLGLSKFQILRYIIFPQAFTFSITALAANCIFLLKETSVLGAIAILDLTNITKDLIGIYYQTFESLLMLVISYLIILLPVSIFLTWLERKVRYAEFGN